LDKCPEDLKFLEGRLDEENQNHKQERSEMALLEIKFVLRTISNVSYTEAIDILRNCTQKRKIQLYH
jgi:asparaginyl-tRNA synthetase